MGSAVGSLSSLLSSRSICFLSLTLFFFLSPLLRLHQIHSGPLTVLDRHTIGHQSRSSILSVLHCPGLWTAGDDHGADRWERVGMDLGIRWFEFQYNCNGDPRKPTWLRFQAILDNWVGSSQGPSGVAKLRRLHTVVTFCRNDRGSTQDRTGQDRIGIITGNVWGYGYGTRANAWH